MTFRDAFQVASALHRTHGTGAASLCSQRALSHAQAGEREGAEFWARVGQIAAALGRGSVNDP